MRTLAGYAHRSSARESFRSLSKFAANRVFFFAIFCGKKIPVCVVRDGLRLNGLGVVSSRLRPLPANPVRVFRVFRGEEFSSFTSFASCEKSVSVAILSDPW
jgi:hypothetical protein